MPRVMPLPPFLFVTAFGDIDQAVSLMREGAADYVTKPFDVAKVIARVQSLIQQQRRAEGERSARRVARNAEVEATLRRISDLTSPVLITGETGVGQGSLRAVSASDFVAVAGTVHRGQLRGDSCGRDGARDLFGYRGASAQAFHRGFAERARGGILFLDEVSELAAARFRPSFCGWSRHASIIGWAASRTWCSTAASSAPPIATFRHW